MSGLLQMLVGGGAGGGASRATAAATLASLPAVVIGPAEVEAKSTCAICLASFELAEAGVCKLPACGHAFHRDECLARWLKEHNTCPVCRAELPIEPEAAPGAGAAGAAGGLPPAGADGGLGGLFAQLLMGGGGGGGGGVPGGAMFGGLPVAGGGGGPFAGFQFGGAPHLAAAMAAQQAAAEAE